jgi:hypothetical protein
VDCLQNITPPMPFDFDEHSGLSSQLPTYGVYGNIGCNDCVIAARAHHTIRLVWAREKSVPYINDPDDVINEYHIETGNLTSCRDGLDLAVSLPQWKQHGWLYGGDPSNEHKIDDCCGPFKVDGCLLPTVPATWPTVTLDLLRAGIYTHVGAVINLVLPKSVQATDPKSFGPGNPWASMPDRSGENHVMLLTGFDVNGAVDNFSGITWGQKQSMTWEFLQSHCWGVFFVQGGKST